MRIFRWDNEELLEAKHAHKCFYEDGGPAGGLGGPGGSAGGGGGKDGNRGDPDQGATGHGGHGSEGGGENVAIMNNCINAGGQWIGNLSSGYCKMPEKKPEKKPESSSGGHSGSSGSSSGYRPPTATPNYGTTNPVPGDTGDSALDASTAALNQSIATLMEMIVLQQQMLNQPVTDDEIDDVSETPTDDLDSTILTGILFDPDKEKRKTSYLTPLSY